MSHTREASRQLNFYAGWEYLDKSSWSPAGNLGARWHKKQRRRHVRRWSQRETIRQLEQVEADRLDYSDDWDQDAAQMAALEQEWADEYWQAFEDDPEFSEYQYDAWLDAERTYWEIHWGMR